MTMTELKCAHIASGSLQYALYVRSRICRDNMAITCTLQCIYRMMLLDGLFDDLSSPIATPTPVRSEIRAGVRHGEVSSPTSHRNQHRVAAVFIFLCVSRLVSFLVFRGDAMPESLSPRNYKLALATQAHGSTHTVQQVHCQPTLHP